MTFAGSALARRLEAAEAANARGCAPSGSMAIEIAGGCAIFAGAASPLTHAVGIGLAGPVSEQEILRLEEFFRSRGAPVSVDLCSLADPGLAIALGERGYRVTEFNNVLLKRLAAKVLPREFDQRRKQGFSIPLAAWLRKGRWRDFFHDVLLDQGCLFDREAVDRLLRGQERGRYNQERLFGLVLFELWRREYRMAL